MRSVKFLAMTAGAVIALATVLVVAPSAAASPAPQPRPAAPSAGSSIQAFATEAAAAQYWTPEKMASAIPAEPQIDPNRASTSTGIEPVLSNARTDIPPVVGTLRPAAMETPRDPMIRPYTNGLERTIGKVFFSRSGLNYVCSGTIVNSESKDLIDTAGHCVNDGFGHWSTNVVFVPGYNPISSNPYPFGIWSEQNMSTTWEWFLNGNFKEDLGYIVLKPLSGRGAIVNYIGGQGSYFNVTRTQTFDALGYPQAAPYNGTLQRLAISVSSGLGDNPWSGWAGPNPMRINSKMTGGSSGGGWIIAVSKTTGLGHVNGHNDYKYISGPKVNSGHMYSPYYGAEALVLYNFSRKLQ